MDQDQADTLFSGVGTESVGRQLLNTTLGEITASVVSIGSVLLVKHVFPKQTEAFIEKTGRALSDWRGRGLESQKKLADFLLNTALTTVSGATGMGLQFGLRRMQQTPSERQGNLYEIGRLMAGRSMGTVAALGTLALARGGAPKAYARSEAALSRLLWGNKEVGALAVINAVQSVAAIPANVPGQLLFDRIAGSREAKRHAETVQQERAAEMLQAPAR